MCDLANPPTQRDARGRRARDESWTLEQVRTMLDGTFEDRLGPVWMPFATTGLRRVEVLGLRWSEVDPDRGRLRISQTITELRGKLVVQDDGTSDTAERSIGLDARSVEALRGWKA